MIKNIKAIFGCDGCGCEFIVEMDPAYKPTMEWDLMAIAEDYIRGDTSVSIQAEMHLCDECTKVADSIGDKDDYQPTKEEIEQALEAKEIAAIDPDDID